MGWERRDVTPRLYSLLLALVLLLVVVGFLCYPRPAA